MGNPSWGKGYHTGYSDGAKTGGVIDAGIAFAITGLAVATRWGYHKIKSLQVKKREQELLDKESILIDCENNGEKEDLSE